MLLAYAAEAAHGAAHAAEKSFPPFDPTLFPHQLFWFALSFIALYFIMARYALPTVAGVLAARAAAVKSDLDAAAAAGAAAEEAKKAAERNAAAARAQARATIDAMRAQAQAEFAEEQSKVEKQLAERAAAAEQRIGDMRAKAMADVNAISADLAQEIAARVTGGSLSQGVAA
ncbi:MAG: F0F1 ATP synthase subunit B' [Hyphomonadaceae bacterium]